MALFWWLLLCAFLGYCAGRKGRNMWAWGLAAVLLSPIIVGIVLALTPDEDNSDSYHSSQSSGGGWGDDEQEEKQCPECGYVSDAGEQYCPRCGEMLC